MAKKPPNATHIGLLSLRLGASLLSSKKNLANDLHAVSETCRTIRNAYVWAWMRWREDHPEWEPTGKSDLWPKEEATAIYHRLAGEHPEIGTVVVNECLQKELKALGQKVPYNHEGKARYVWQALLLHERNPQNARPGIIPLHYNSIRLCYAGDMFGPQTGAVASRLKRFGSSSAVVALSLYSQTRKSGRLPSVFCRIETRQMSKGRRKILRLIAQGEWPVKGSLLVYKEKHKAWFLQLTYGQPQKPLGLNPESVATFSLAPKEAEQPFLVTLGEDKPTWKLGFRVLEREYASLERRRLALRTKYKVAGHGRKGHGRRRLEYPLRKITHRLHDLMERFTDMLIADLLKFCVGFDAGTIDYREPSLGARLHTWFAKRKIPYDWTNLLAKLKQKCFLMDIDLRVNGVRVTKKEAAVVSA